MEAARPVYITRLRPFFHAYFQRQKVHARARLLHQRIPPRGGSRVSRMPATKARVGAQRERRGTRSGQEKAWNTCRCRGAFSTSSREMKTARKGVEGRPPPRHLRRRVLSARRSSVRRAHASVTRLDNKSSAVRAEPSRACFRAEAPAEGSSSGRGGRWKRFMGPDDRNSFVDVAVSTAATATTPLALGVLCVARNALVSDSHFVTGHRLGSVIESRVRYRGTLSVSRGSRVQGQVGK